MRDALLWMLLPVLAGGSSVTGIGMGCSDAVGVIQNTGTFNAGRNLNTQTCADEARLKSGQDTFRYETFGDEAFFGSLGLHHVISTMSPNRAMQLGLEIDRTALGAEPLDMDDPSSTIKLLSLGAIVGIRGFVNEQGVVTGAGITCALCHSIVDDSRAERLLRHLRNA